MSAGQAPQGLECPWCGQLAVMVDPVSGQAFCGNGSCRVICWNPDLPISEQPFNEVELSALDGFPPDGDGDQPPAANPDGPGQT